MSKDDMNTILMEPSAETETSAAVAKEAAKAANDSLGKFNQGQASPHVSRPQRGRGRSGISSAAAGCCSYSNDHQSGLRRLISISCHSFWTKLAYVSGWVKYFDEFQVCGGITCIDLRVLPMWLGTHIDEKTFIRGGFT